MQIGAGQIRDFTKAFDFPNHYSPPFEVIQDEVMRRGSFNLINQDSGIKVEITPGFETSIATPEDVILKNLSFTNEWSKAWE